MYFSSTLRFWFAAITVPRYLLHTLECTGGCSEDPARVSHSQGEHHFCWDRAEVTRTERSDLDTKLKKPLLQALQRTPSCRG